MCRLAYQGMKRSTRGEDGGACSAARKVGSREVGGRNGGGRRPSASVGEYIRGLCLGEQSFEGLV